MYKGSLRRAANLREQIKAPEGNVFYVLVVNHVNSQPIIRSHTNHPNLLSRYKVWVWGCGEDFGRFIFQLVLTVCCGDTVRSLFNVSQASAVHTYNKLSMMNDLLYNGKQKISDHRNLELFDL
jgi:hypothetical protein